MGRMQPRKLQCCICRDQSESPIFVILCVLCFQTQSFLTFIRILNFTILRGLVKRWLFFGYLLFNRNFWGSLSKVTIFCLSKFSMYFFFFFFFFFFFAGGGGWGGGGGGGCAGIVRIWVRNFC